MALGHRRRADCRARARRTSHRSMPEKKMDHQTSATVFLRALDSQLRRHRVSTCCLPSDEAQPERFDTREQIQNGSRDTLAIGPASSPLLIQNSIHPPRQFSRSKSKKKKKCWSSSREELVWPTKRGERLQRIFPISCQGARKESTVAKAAQVSCLGPGLDDKLHYMDEVFIS